MLWLSLRQSFGVLSRFFTLLYPLLGLALLLSALMPQEAPALEWRWGILFALLFLLYCAMMAGWYAMIGDALRKTLLPTPAEEKPSMLPDSFKVFRSFLPGIGQYFAPVVVGNVVFFAGVALLVGVCWWLIANWAGGWPPVFEELLKLNGNQLEAARRLQALTGAETLQFTRTMVVLMGGVIAYALYTLLMVFWPACLVLGNMNIGRAVLKSMQIFLKHPFAALTGGGLYLGVTVLLSEMAQVPNPLFQTVVQLLSFMWVSYCTVLIFVFAHHQLEVPVISPAQGS
jgi:hypothetical protein